MGVTTMGKLYCGRLYRLGRNAMILAAALAVPAGAHFTAADEIRADIAKGMKDGTIAVDKAADGGRCAVANVSLAVGTLFTAATPALKPGVYDAMLYIKLKLINNLNTGGLTWTMTVDGASEKVLRNFDILNIEKAGVYQAIPCRFAVDKQGAVNVSLAWKRTSLNSDGSGIRMRVEKSDMPAKPESSVGIDAPEQKNSELDAETELANEPPLEGLKYLWCAVEKVSIVPVSDVAVTRLDVDKIRYKPGEKAQVSVAVRNYAGTARDLKVETEFVNDLDNIIPADSRTLKLGPGAAEAFTFTGPEFKDKWGYAVRCRISDGGKALAEKSEYFTVHGNMWAVVIAGRGPAQFTAHVTKENAAASAQDNKRRYRNWVESGFWAPDEFGDFTPDTEFWWGGQGCYYGSVTGTRTMTEEGHKAGISFAVYSNIWGGDGPPAFEMVRANPDWGWPAGFDVEWFDRWDRNTMGTGKPGRGMHVWPYTCINYSATAAFEHHGHELIESHRTLGWDAVRYDSHAISDENARVVDIVKKVVRAEVPEFQFGYNSSTPLGVAEKLAAFKAECEGEGLIMEEGIRQFGGGGMSFSKGRTYEDFARRILTMKEEARSNGGHFLAIGMDKCFPNDLIYQYIFWFAGNTHPCYDWLDSSVANYMQFATRFAGQLWDLKVRPVPNALQWIDFGEAAEYLWLPDQYIHQRDLGNGRRQLIVHIINAPLEKQIFTFDDAKVPPPREKISVKVKMPDQAKLRCAWLLTAEPELQQTRLEAAVQGGAASATVPRLRFWDVLVFDFDNAPEFK